ncbi:MAG: glycosyltransferase family 4 protein [Muribaculaceae bacterium]|nr:glycosyltransferase family 4 protein [Muribaculaceae bacterium]
MKIALVNYRYFISGGPERYYFNIKEVLERHGHEVVPFSVKSSKNFDTPYDKYFLESVDDSEYFAKTRKNVSTVLKSFTRMFYSFEAKRKFTSLLRDTCPDLVYIMQYHNKISPSIIDAARSMGIPVVHRISDFQYMCPNALFYNERTGVCEDCLKGKRLSCVRNRCVMNSTVYSAIKAGAKALHDAMGVTRRVDAFVVPSSFTMSKLNEYGIDATRLNHIPTFFNLRPYDASAISYEPFFLYVGRVERQKGLQTLVDAVKGTRHRLKIIGFSNDGYDLELKKSLTEAGGNIEFLGRMSFDEIVPYLQSCRCTVVPSEWYDNFPNAILESFAYRKAVIATDFGSLPELVENDVTGLTFKYRDVADLRRCLDFMADNESAARAMGERAFELIQSRYSPEVHYASLMKLFDSLADKKKN